MKTTKHLFVSEAGITGNCEMCGRRYEHDNHKEFWGIKSADMYHLPEDDRIDLIASEVSKGQIVGVLLEMGIGKVERYISKLAQRYPDVRLISRVWGPGPTVETVTFGPKVQA